MRELKISNLKNVTQEMIDGLEVWLKGVAEGKLIAGNACPYDIGRCLLVPKPETPTCRKLFDNLKTGCPCLIYGVEATILAFTIIRDVWDGEVKDG